jgi:DNA-binding MarR family transcriptional regulator
MLDVAAFEKLDQVIHPEARLKIMTLLAARESLSFKELKEFLAMTDGNLCVHMRTLEEHGYISVRKSFVNRKPLTEYTLTPEGRQAFDDYLQALTQIIKQSQPAVHAEPATSRDARTVLPQGMATAK